MMRSMFSGVSSIRVHQTRMDVIANNIANVNTDGFKSQRATFADAFYQNLQGASGPDPAFGRAGRNPMQVGLGLNLASIDNLMHQGVARRTDNPLDVAIEGGGFFIVRDRGGANLFTRAGRIERDAHWNLHISGNSLMGWGTVRCSETPGGWAVNRGLLEPISLSGEKQNMPSEATTRVNFTGNLNRTDLNVQTRQGLPGEPTTVDMRYREVPKTIFDSLGNKYTITLRYTYHQEFSEAAESPHGYWTMEAFGDYYVDNNGDWELWQGTGMPPANAVRLVHAYRDDDPQRRDPALIAICFLGEYGETGTAGYVNQFATLAQSSVTIAFNSNGDMVGMGHVGEPLGGGWQSPLEFDPESRGDGWWGGREFNASIIPVRGVAPSATFGDTSMSSSSISYYDPETGNTRIADGQLTMNFTELGQRGQANTSVRALTWDGGGPGVLEDISVGQDGTIMGRYSNGRDRILGQIPLAFFSNPAGLDRVGGSFWRATANSGMFDGVGLVGQMIGSALEGSNVDLAGEFTDMITTQRGFQAASRTITVSDEMLQELVNLKR